MCNIMYVVGDSIYLRGGGGVDVREGWGFKNILPILSPREIVIGTTSY